MSDHQEHPAIVGLSEILERVAALEAAVEDRDQALLELSERVEALEAGNGNGDPEPPVPNWVALVDGQGNVVATSDLKVAIYPNEE